MQHQIDGPYYSVKLNSLDLFCFHRASSYNEVLTRGSYITLFLPSSHSKQFPVTSLRFTEYIYGIVGKARCAHLSTSHHIKPEPLGEGLMWWLVLRWAHLAVPNDVVCIFSFEYLSKTAKSNWLVERIGESVRWADLTIRLIVKANIMSVRWGDLTIRLIVKPTAWVRESHYLRFPDTPYTWLIWLVTPAVKRVWCDGRLAR